MVNAFSTVSQIPSHGVLYFCDLIQLNRFTTLVATTIYLFIVTIYETFENHFHRYTVFIYNLSNKERDNMTVTYAQQVASSSKIGTFRRIITM